MTTKNVTVYDPAMCCATGVCGPEVDPKLARFSADLEWLATRGVEVRRFNLAQEPGAFAQDAAVKTVLEREGEAGLPLIKVDGEIVSSGAYPTRDELLTWVGTSASSTSAAPPKTGGCCGPAQTPASAEKTSGCC